MSGKVMKARDRLSSSGATAVQRPNAASSSGAAWPGKNRPPPYRRGTGIRSISSSVVTPKFPPPPRMAQNSSGSVSAVTSRGSPVAVTTRSRRTRSAL